MSSRHERPAHALISWAPLALLAIAIAVHVQLPKVAAEQLLADFEPFADTGPSTSSSSIGPNDDKCTKCNIPVDQGGCKCDNNCDCKSGPTGWQTSTATYYDPDGGFGACGTKLQNSDMIVALGVQSMGATSYPYPNCGKCIQVQCVSSTSAAPGCLNSNVITVRVADRCEACEKDGHLDLSEGAFSRIANKDAGVVNIRYKYTESGC